MSQQLSLEMDLLPEAACRELGKAYHQVPPINKALVRKVIQSGLGRPPETLFKHFDLHAFAAASLGQVHAAMDNINTQLAVKIQYPGISKTIENDMVMLRRMLSPIIQNDQLAPMIEEIAARLNEEVDYVQEAAHVDYFGRHLSMEGVRIPQVMPEFSCRTILTTTRLPGKPLDRWILDGPDQDARDKVAQKIQDIFIQGVYDLHVVHADPNPGNFIIDEDLTVGLIDYGCVKRLSPSFVDVYRRLVKSAYLGRERAHVEQMVAMGFIPEHSPESIKSRVQDVAIAISRWLGRLCEDDRFDFGAHHTFFHDGRKIMRDFNQLRKYVRINPDFLFLDRTRYGVLRIFEQMGARVRFRNPHEWDISLKREVNS